MPLPVEYSPLTDSHLLDTVVRRSTPFGESSVLGSYLKRHVCLYVALVISEMSFLSNFCCLNSVWTLGSFSSAIGGRTSQIRIDELFSFPSALL